MTAMVVLGDLGEKVLLIVVSAALGYAINEIQYRVKARRERPIRVAVCMESIAGHLSEMVQKLQKREIPRDPGHTINKILLLSKKDLQRELNDLDMNSLVRLNDLAERAKQIDGAYLGEYHPGERMTVETWITDAQRAAGDLKGRAAVLKLRG
jgi:hypothetical protein